MCIKFFIVAILLSLIVTFAKATGQSGDVIRLEGEEWVLLGKPIESDTMLGNRVRAFLPDNISYSTGNYSCYTASWEIRNGYLCLRWIEADVYDEASNKESTLVYEGKDLQSLFPSYYKMEKFKPVGSVGSFEPEKEIWSDMCMTVSTVTWKWNRF